MTPDLTLNDLTCSDVRGLAPSISSKWAMMVMAILDQQPRRFSEIKRALGEITQKSLTAALRDLEKDGLLTRTVTPIIPPRVDYELTPLGRSLLEPARALGHWAFANREALTDARHRFNSLR